MRAMCQISAPAPAASSAQGDAARATTYANAALDQLSVVQDVAGVLTWASEHGSFTKTSDTAIVDGKVYFTLDSATGDYSPVVDPQASQLFRSITCALAQPHRHAEQVLPQPQLQGAGG